MQADAHEAPSPVVVEYLELIHALHAEGADVFAVTLAEQFGVSRANASATVQRMLRDGLVQVDGRQIQLTERGRAEAESGLRRQRVAERFLADVLAMDWTIVAAQARHFGRGLTPLLEERMDRRLGYPRTCPHGNPIPRPDLDAASYLRAQRALRLATAPHGAPLTILAIGATAERDTARLRAYQARGLVPGAALTVLARAADGALTARGGAGAVSIDPLLAASLWVTRATGDGEEPA